MSDRYDPDYVDREEKELMEDIDAMDDNDVQRPSGERQRELRQAARAHVNKRATKMNIRIDADELERIKKQADKEGLRYQSLVKSVLHKYITGQLVDRDQKAG